MLIFGDFVGTVKRENFLIDLDTESDYFRKFEGQRIQALSLPVKSRNLSTLLGRIERCFQRGWEKMDAGEWTQADFNEVYELSQQISAEIMELRGNYKERAEESYSSSRPSVKVESSKPILAADLFSCVPY